MTENIIAKFGFGICKLSSISFFKAYLFNEVIKIF